MEKQNNEKKKMKPKALANVMDDNMLLTLSNRFRLVTRSDDV